MAVGFIQLIFTGNEMNIFNKNPNITFFKIYYRRHSNFYINNYIVEGNDIKKNKLVSFNIPSSGDLLSKNYLYIDYDTHFFELFYNYTNLYNTLNTKIVNLLDSYSITTISFKKQDIINVNKIKINLEYCNEIYLSIFCNYNPNNTAYVDILKNEENLYLQSDSNNYFFNINEHYNYYSFIYNNINNESPSNILSTGYIINSIVYDKINLLRIDINNINFSLNINNYHKCNTDLIYEIIKYFLNIFDINNKRTMSIFKNELYISFSYDNFIIPFVKKQIINYSNDLKIKVIQDKTTTSIVNFNKNDDVENFMKSLDNLFNISKNYIVYINLFMDNQNTDIILTLMKNSSFVGNLSNNDYNQYLINKETKLITSSNLSTTEISTNLFIKLVIIMVCTNEKPTLQNFMNIINSNNFNYLPIINYYSNNIEELYVKLLDIIMIERPLILNNSNLLKILYSYNIKKLYKNESLNANNPFSNQKILDFSQIINYYFYKNCIDKFLSNTTSSDNRLLTIKTILELINNNETNLSLYDNYYKNNYLYADNSANLLQIKDTIDNKISNNIFQFMIYSSINISKNIIYKKSYDIYENNGLNTSIFNFQNIETSIFPMSGFLYSGFNSDVNLKYDDYKFMTSYNDYIHNIVNVQDNIFNSSFNKYKTNPNDKLLNTFSSSIYYTEFTNLVLDYYTYYVQYFKNTNFQIINNFLSVINTENNNINNINNYFIENIYSYTNKHLFNNSFNNLFNGYETEKNKTFIFLQNSPLYKLFYSYLFIEKFKIDSKSSGDIVILIEFIADFLTTFIEYFYKNNTFNNKNNFNFSRIFDETYLLDSNFCCCGNINFLTNKKLINILNEKNYTNVYSSYYFLKILNIFSNNPNDYIIENNFKYINEIINTSKKSYDDLIIILFLSTLNDNKNIFKNYDNVNIVMNTIFDKNNFSLKSTLSSLNNLSDETLDLSFIDLTSTLEENYYYASYYTIFHLGNLFDNINSLNLNVTNLIYNLTKELLIGNNNLDSVTVEKENTLKFRNIYSSENIFNLISKINIPYTQVFNSTNSIVYSHFNNLCSYLLSILNIDNFIYSIDIERNIFDEMVYIIQKYIQFFNENNYTKVRFNTLPSFVLFPVYFKYYGLSIIISFITYYINNCMKIDIDNFLKEQLVYSTNTFNDYLIDKYSKNTYIDILNEINIIIKNNPFFIKINFFNNLLYKYPLNNKSINDKNIYHNLNGKNDTDNYLNKIIYDNFYKNNSEIIPSNYYSCINLNIKEGLLETSSQIYYNNNKIFYTLYQNIITNVIGVSVDSSRTIQEYYDLYKDSFYNNSISKIKNISTYLNNIYSSLVFTNNYSIKICNSALTLIKSFYNEGKNYYSLMYYKKFLQKNKKNIYSNTINNYYSDYLNLNINNSLYFEENINSIVYLLCSNYIIINKDIDADTKYTLLNSPLYNIVKLFNSIKIKDDSNYSSSKLKKIYIENTNLYINQNSFQLFNYENLADNKSLIQNEQILNIMEEIELDDSKDNSYLGYLKQFINYYTENKLDLIINFKLESQILVSDFFLLNTTLISEYVYNYLTLHNYYSPRQIFVDILEFSDYNSYKPEININYDEMKKKMFIFMYFNFIILTKISCFLKKELIENIKNVNLEFDIKNEIYDIELKNVYEQNLNDILFTIDYIYSFNDNNIVVLEEYFKNKNINNNLKNSIIKIIYATKNKININETFTNLINSYIEFYYENIDDTKIPLIYKKNNTVTYKNLVNILNTIFYYDQYIENKEKYQISIYIYNKFNFSLNNTIFQHFNKSVLSFISIDYDNYLNNLNKVNIIDFNLSFILVTIILEFYNIKYSYENQDINYPLFSLKMGNTNLNTNIDYQKGLYTLEQSGKNFYSSPSNNIYTRINNVVKLYAQTKESNNLNVINPSSFDNSVNFMNSNFIYQNRLNKYYDEKYNYYNYLNNYSNIYNQLFEYYTNIINDITSIKIIKNNINFYEKMFYEIFSTFISNSYSKLKSFNPNTYIPLFNELIIIYINNIFTYKHAYINNNSVGLYNYFSKNINFTNYDLMYKYLENLYFYQVFGFFPSEFTHIVKETKIENTFYGDFLNFFDTINNSNNQNMIYSNIYYNSFYKIKIIVNSIVKLINYTYVKNFKIIENLTFDDIENNIYNKIINKKSIFKFTNQFYYQNNKKDNLLFINNYYAILNLVNPKIFYTKMSSFIESYIYYTGINSKNVHLEYLYNEYFNNIKFEYLVFDLDLYSTKVIIFTRLFIESFVYSYLNYYFNNDKIIDCIIANIITNFENIFVNDDTNLNYHELISGVFDNETIIMQNNNPKDINFSNFANNLFNCNNQYNSDKLIDMYINDNIIDCKFHKKIKFLNKKYYIIKKIVFSVFNYYWGISIIEKNNSIKNSNLRISLVLFNFYYYSLKQINNPAKIENLKYFIDNLPSLNILFNLIQKLIPFINLDSALFEKIIVLYLTDVHTFVFNKQINFTIDNSKIVASRFDFLNSNYIIKNTINNYYKNVQLNTIFDLKKYNIDSVDTTAYFSNDKYIESIYNNLFSQYNINNEFTLGINIFDNILINSFNNYNNITQIYDNDNNFIESFYIMLFKNIKLKLGYVLELLGGAENNNFQIGNNGIYFSQEMFSKNENSVTIFSALHENLNKLLNNNCLVMFFYYLCYLTWVMTKIDTDEFTLNKELYFFSNYINQEIISFLNNPTYPNELFNGLNIILLKSSTNEEYIKECNNLFNNLSKINIATFDYPILKNLETTKYMIDNKIGNIKSLYNDGYNDVKINKWKYFMGLIVDYNKSEIIKIFKSINPDVSLINIQPQYIKYILKLINGYINEYGIINTIKSIELVFDNEQIDSYSKFAYKIFYDLIEKTEKKIAFAKMIGSYDNDNIIDGNIRPYIKKFMKKQFILPIKFYYEDFSNVIPLISMLYSKIKLNIHNDDSTIFRNNLLTFPITDSYKKYKLDIDYIFIEKDERIKKTKYKIDNIIGTHNFYKPTLNCKISDLLNITNDEMSISFDLEMYNLCERLIWTLDITINNNNFINNSSNDLSLNNIFGSYKQSYFENNKINSNLFISQVKLYIDGGLISSVNNLSEKNYKIVNLINLYKYTSAPKTNKNYNCNCFSLEPDVYQPTGALNMSMFKYFTIKIIFDKKVFQDFLYKVKVLYGFDDIMFTLNLSSNEYNLIRYQSGLSGLLFIK
jgi:hypothetical protein